MKTLKAENTAKNIVTVTMFEDGTVSLVKDSDNNLNSNSLCHNLGENYEEIIGESVLEMLKEDN
mgnify:CR=1 FL=1|tara:strand:- start:720 stop:911 length:192 start_codon:yes stop_codon:yes gene_type:complete